MATMREFVKTTSVAAILLCSATSVAVSQEQADATNGQNVISETFDGDDMSLMLGGQISFNGDSAPWLVYVSDGQFVLENRKEPKSLHYNDITWVQFPDANVLISTENLVISTVVDVKNVGNGGAGIVIGSGKAGLYLFFSVDGQGRYHILSKDGRNLRRVHSAKHAAVLVDEPNQLTFEVRGANVAFLANGTEITQVPLMNRLANSRATNGQAGIGIAAFGIGKFFFDNIEISKAN